jgi:hypothetical protein
VDVGVVGLVEMPEGDSDSSSGCKTAATGMVWSGSTRTVAGPVESALAILESDLDLGGSCVANEDLWEVEAVGSPRVRAMT